LKRPIIFTINIDQFILEINIVGNICFDIRRDGGYGYQGSGNSTWSGKDTASGRLRRILTSPTSLCTISGECPLQYLSPLFPTLAIASTQAHFCEKMPCSVYLALKIYCSSTTPPSTYGNDFVVLNNLNLESRTFVVQVRFQFCKHRFIITRPAGNILSVFDRQSIAGRDPRLRLISQNPGCDWSTDEN